jgi:hypothetical protein
VVGVEKRATGPKSNSERFRFGFSERIAGRGLYFDGGDPLGVGESASEVVGGVRSKTHARERDGAKIEIQAVAARF